jgi:hypothetical protein
LTDCDVAALRRMAKALVKDAIGRLRTRDNVSVIVVQLAATDAIKAAAASRTPEIRLLRAKLTRHEQEAKCPMAPSAELPSEAPPLAGSEPAAPATCTAAMQPLSGPAHSELPSVAAALPSEAPPLAGSKPAAPATCAAAMQPLSGPAHSELHSEAAAPARSID